MNAKELLQRYMEEGHSEFADTALTDVNQRGQFGNTALHLACLHGIIEDVEALLTAGAELNAVGEFGDTPLHNAVRKGNVALVKRLLEAGAQPVPHNDFLERPKDLAVYLGHHDVVAVLDDWCRNRE